MQSDFARDGFAVIPEYLSTDELAGGQAGLPQLFPTADEFHDDVDPARNKRFRDEFAGITNFPFDSVELSLLAVHPRLITLAEELLGTDDLRVYSIEAWAKYTGAAAYEQEHHRDYLGHSVVVPDPNRPPAQVEMFVYLSDVTPEHAPPSFVALEHTRHLPSLPNWLPRDRVRDDGEHPTWVSHDLWPELYAREVSGTGRAGTVVAYRIETFHRATDLTARRGARYTLHVNFRRTDAEWINRRAWPLSGDSAAWDAFVARASVRQLVVFGFPPPGHPYWTGETLAGTALRYPGFDPDPWCS
ncbi:MAG: hypothetical protein QOG90_1124 [Actinomycetota bacterium]